MQGYASGIIVALILGMCVPYTTLEVIAAFDSASDNDGLNQYRAVLILGLVGEVLSTLGLVSPCIMHSIATS